METGRVEAMGCDAPAAAKRAIQERYDRRAEAELGGQGAFEPLGRAKAYFRKRKLTTALALGSFPAGGRLLEIGCSVGQFSFALARQGYRVHGVDLSPRSVALAARRVEAEGLPVEFSVGETEDLRGLPENGYDGVVSFSTLRYVANLSQALAEIRRVLKPSATAVVDFPNRWCPWFYLKPWLGSERHPHDRWFTAGAVRALFAQAGFEQIRVRHLLFTPTVVPDRWLAGFQAADWLGERLPLVRRLAGIIMVAARKP